MGYKSQNFYFIVYAYMKKKYAKKLLDKNKEDYNRIAFRFAKKREWISPDILALKKYVSKGEKILDLGCGNGRLKKILGQEIYYFGLDVSKELINIAKKLYPGIRCAPTDPLSFNLENNSFDKVFCLSVLHHIPSKKFRKDFLKEIGRILKPEGQLILTVWDLRSSDKAKRLLLKYTLLKLIGKSKLDFRDIFYPWKDNKEKVLAQRYVHIFSLRELEYLFKKSGFVIKEEGVLVRSKKGRNIFFVTEFKK